MLRLRPYKNCDASEIVNWIQDKKSFRMWCSDRYESFPVTADEMNFKYFDCNGDCVETDNFYPMTAYDEDGIKGHFIIRYINGDTQNVRLGLVIVDPDFRGQGLGKEMIGLGLDYAFNFLMVNRVTIGVFDCNMGAYYCYLSAGFKNVPVETGEGFHYKDETCDEIWQVIEMEMTRDDYEKKNSRSQIFSKPRLSRLKGEGLFEE